MKNSVSLLRSANRVLLLQHSFKRQFIQSRRYVNWTPDKPSKKKNGKIIPPTQLNPTGSPPQSPVEPNKVFHPSPPTSQSEHVTTTESEPQLIRLKNKKTFNQWEKEWNERVWRVGQATLIVGILIAGYAIGAGYVHLPYGMNYRPSKLPQEGTDEEMEYLNRVKNALHSLSIVQRLSEDKDWIKTIGIFATPKEDIPHHLTNGVLAGTGKITVKPVTFWNNKTKEFVVVMHVGQDVCGHRGLVHGGFLATMLDECMGKTAIVTLSKEYDANGKKRQVWPEDRIIVTANLNINYLAPTKVNQFIVIKTILVEATEKKAKVKGRIETIEETPRVLVGGEALFVKPSKEAVKKIIAK